MITTVDAEKTRKKRDPGRCFARAGWTRVSEDSQGRDVFRLSPCPSPLASRAVGSALGLFE